jgi:2-C-methyl-D-erythritol 2,4-cyclodiphosphate synthase
MIRAAGYRVCSLDTVVIAEQPKVGPFAAQMRESLANAMKVSPGCVNIKGKTTEGLGPTGTGEAIAALAVAMVVDMRSGAAI